ncbi:MAG: lycopene cyclase domain-containing protein [Acidimicrobiia bacterium]
MDRYQYLLLMGLCVAITLPLEVLLRARVWRRPRRLLGALAPALGLFVAWDLWATASGTWGFSDDYTIGLDLPGGMAVEELVFFTVIPICGLLTLETVRRILRIWDATSGSTSERLAGTAHHALGPDAAPLRPAPAGPAATSPARPAGEAATTSARGPIDTPRPVDADGPGAQVDQADGAGTEGARAARAHTGGAS